MAADKASYHAVPDAIDTDDLLEPLQPDKWHNIGNLDLFFTRVYDYFQGKGFYTILMSRALSLVIFAFVVCCAVFVFGYLDYNLVFTVKDIKAAIKTHAIEELPLFLVLCTIIFGVYWLWEFLKLLYAIRGLWEMKQFYHHKLNIDEKTLQTAQWNEVVERLIEVHNREKLVVVKERLTPHDIVSRIMRADNYLIAMFNKDLLAISLRIPFIGTSKVLTKTLEWNLSFCVLNYMFDKNHDVKREFLDPLMTPRLASSLKRRFILMGLLNLIVAPFMIVMLLLWFFLKYAEEFHRDPGNIGMRTFTSLARWRFREFNELQNVFQKRLISSRKHALDYILMFPSGVVAVLARFVTFIVAALAAILIGLSLIDADVLLSLHIGEKAVVWYLGVFGAILAVSRSLAPSETTAFEPEKVLRRVSHHTHYLPKHWRGKAHTPGVYDEFQKLLTFRVVVFLQELISVVITPLVLIFSMPRCAAQIVAFIRECTVDVDGVGYVCLFSRFDFKNNGDPFYGSLLRTDGRGDRMSASDGKMEKSYISFRKAYPTWRPDPHQGGGELEQNLHQFHSSASASFTKSRIIESPLLPPRAPTSIQAPPTVAEIHEDRVRAVSEGIVQHDADPEMSLLLPTDTLFSRGVDGIGLRMPRQYYVDLLDVYYNAHIPHDGDEATDAVDVNNGDVFEV